MKRALITGATGQCGSYLSEHLLDLGYQVYAMVRRNTCFTPEKSLLKRCLTHPNFHLVKGDVTDPYSLERLANEIHPDELYNAAAQSHVGESWEYPIATVDATAKGVLHCLEIIRKVVPYCKFLQFSSSELFGMVRETPQNEATPFYPRSPYGVSKLFGYWMTINYRESYDLFCCNAILFNMESPRRGSAFVTQKIAQGVARIARDLKKGLTPEPLVLGNLQAKRDWNDARYSVTMLPKILAREKPEDYVIGSGVAHSISDFLTLAFAAVGIDDYKDYVKTSAEFVRPAEVNMLLADPSKAKQDLGYDPTQQDFNNLVKEMVRNAQLAYGNDWS
jgi:GDPmannose 4,6-dehydratase